MSSNLLAYIFSWRLQRLWQVDRQNKGPIMLTNVNILDLFEVEILNADQQMAQFFLFLFVLFQKKIADCRTEPSVPIEPDSWRKSCCANRFKDHPKVACLSLTRMSALSDVSCQVSPQMLDKTTAAYKTTLASGNVALRRASMTPIV